MNLDSYSRSTLTVFSCVEFIDCTMQFIKFIAFRGLFDDDGLSNIVLYVFLNREYIRHELIKSWGDGNCRLLL